MKSFRYRLFSLFIACFFLVQVHAQHMPDRNDGIQPNASQVSKVKNAPSSWTIMIYAQADSILNNFAVKNFQAMATIGSNSKVNIITQWNQPRKDGVWRYRIEKNTRNPEP